LDTLGVRSHRENTLLRTQAVKGAVRHRLDGIAASLGGIVVELGSIHFSTTDNTDGTDNKLMNSADHALPVEFLIQAWTERIKHCHRRPDDGFAQPLVNQLSFRANRLIGASTRSARVWAGSAVETGPRVNDHRNGPAARHRPSMGLSRDRQGPNRDLQGFTIRMLCVSAREGCHRSHEATLMW
jgi:hypothetical protein